MVMPRLLRDEWAMLNSRPSYWEENMNGGYLFYCYSIFGIYVTKRYFLSFGSATTNVIFLQNSFGKNQLNQRGQELKKTVSPLQSHGQ